VGLVRFLLAILVVLSHLDKRFFGLNLGVFAVVVFYLFCGFSQSKVWARYLKIADKNAIKAYYFNRALRILPQYFFALFLGMIICLVGSKSSYLSAGPSILGLIQNILLIPLNYFMFTGVDHFTLVPPAWSLALEIQFYLLFPFIARDKFYGFTLVFALSLSVFVLSQFHYLNLEYFGYRLLPGMLFVFLAGYLFNAHLKISRVRYLIIALWILTFVYAIVLLTFKMVAPFNLEVLLGLLVGLPATYIFSRNRFFVSKKIDSILGASSYGIFLYHFFVIWGLAFFPLINHAPLLVISLSFILALMGHYFIEIPLWHKLSINNYRHFKFIK